MQLFQDEGLVLVDSADDLLRQLETEVFVRLIEKQSVFSPQVANAEKQLRALGYAVTLNTEATDGHLFYHQDNERILLERDAEGNWQGKDSILLTTAELLEIARTSPERLSNNVVTRPVMQEALFPTLGFIGGPGEISYWAALKPAFQALNFNMPPVVPRLSYTYIPRKVQKALEFTKVDIEQAIQNGIAIERKQFVDKKQQPSIDDLADELKATIEKAHQPMQDAATDIRADVHHLAEKNLFYLKREVDFLKKRMKMALEDKYKKELHQYDLVAMYARPENGFQERTWNPLPFLNEYGMDWIKEVVNSPVSMREKHYVVYL